MVIGGSDSLYKVHCRTIWCYKRDLRSWHPFEISLPRGLSSFGCVLTHDQKYVIIMGRQCNGYPRVTDDIIVLDLERKTIKTSKIKCPEAGRFKAFIVPISFKNNLIVFGFLRMYCCQRRNINDDAADVTCSNIVYGKARDIVGIIITMYDNGNDIHLFSECNKRGHWIMNANHIIDALE